MSSMNVSNETAKILNELLLTNIKNEDVKEMVEKELRKIWDLLETEELCKEGQRLWDAVDYHNPNSYDDYRRHILECKKCQEELELRESDLKNIKEDIERGGKR